MAIGLARLNGGTRAIWLGKNANWTRSNHEPGLRAKVHVKLYEVTVTMCSCCNLEGAKLREKRSKGSF
jgi:hypothetical protein